MFDGNKQILKFKVNIGRTNRYFANLAKAKAFCSAWFTRTGVVLSIVEV